MDDEYRVCYSKGFSWSKMIFFPLKKKKKDIETFPPSQGDRDCRAPVCTDGVLRREYVVERDEGR